LVGFLSTCRVSTICDGAAEVESDGFFDEFNCPPWGTWVGIYTDPAGGISREAALVAWVPPALVDLAGRGIDVNPEGCILWLDDADPMISRAFGLG